MKQLTLSEITETVPRGHRVNPVQSFNHYGEATGMVYLFELDHMNRIVRELGFGLETPRAEPMYTPASRSWSRKALHDLLGSSDDNMFSPDNTILTRDDV